VPDICVCEFLTGDDDDNNDCSVVGGEDGGNDNGDDEGRSDWFTAGMTVVPVNAVRLLLRVGSEKSVDGCERGSLNEAR
jgi:hypothetical protein